MNVKPAWVVDQQNAKTGCIPTGYEMLIRAAGIDGIEFAAFQTDFDRGTSNNFDNVASKIMERYPQVPIRVERDFSDGADKVARIFELMEADSQPILLSCPTGQGYHIMAIAEVRAGAVRILDGLGNDRWVADTEIIDWHDNNDGGKELAYLAIGDRA